MRIYKIYKNRICSLKVRETKKQYIVIGESELAFGCGRGFSKSQCSISIKEALIKEIKNLVKEKRKHGIAVLKTNMRLQKIRLQKPQRLK